MLEVAVVAAVVLGLANTVAVVYLVRSANEELIQTREGLPLGAAIPAFDAAALDGSRATERDAASRLLLFLGASCRPCHLAARELAMVETSVLRKLLIVVTGDPSPVGDNLFDLLGFMPRNLVTHDQKREVAERLAITTTPFVYAIDRSGRVRAKSLTVTAKTLKTLASGMLGTA